MLAANRVLIMLTVLLCAPFASMISTEVSASEDILKIAASNWHSIEPYAEESSPLKAVDYTIHLSSGSFDPLVDEAPDSRIPDALDYRNTGMAIVQFHHHLHLARPYLVCGMI